jgi:coenzyme F420-reducing hydrogenase delta subunit
MTSRYYYINFPNLEIRTFDSPQNSNCAICRTSDIAICGKCVYGTGNQKWEDRFSPIGRILVGIGVRRNDYYDEIVSSLVEQKQNVVDDIKKYRQW